MPTIADNHADRQMNTIVGGGFAEVTGRPRVASSRDKVLGAMGLKAVGFPA